MALNLFDIFFLIFKVNVSALKLQSVSGEADTAAAVEELLVSAEAVLGEWLDKEKGATVTDNSLFMELPRHFENEYNQDMLKLNVRF